MTSQYSVIVASHLAWVKARPNFICRSWIRMNPTHGMNPSNVTCSYFDMLELLYSNYPINPDAVDELATVWYKQDLNQVQEMELAKTTLLKDLARPPPEAFVTIGFNHQEFNIPQTIELIQRILDSNNVISGSAVFELHRENGEHPHVHFVLEHVSMSKSKFLEKLWATKGIKKLVLKKSFIDYKPALAIHHNYIKGEKQEKKLKYVTLDSNFREKNGIPSLFTKS